MKLGKILIIMDMGQRNSYIPPLREYPQQKGFQRQQNQKNNTVVIKNVNYHMDGSTIHVTDHDTIYVVGDRETSIIEFCSVAAQEMNSRNLSE